MIAIEAYENAALHTLKTEATPDNLKIWAQAYNKLQKSLTTNREETLTQKPSASLRGNGYDAIRALIYGGKTLRIIQRLIAVYPLSPGSVLEIGAGWGPCGIAAAASGCGDISLLEHSRRMLDLSSALFSRLGYAAPDLREADLNTGLGKSLVGEKTFANIFVPFVLNEILSQTAADEGKARAEEFIRRCLSVLQPGGRLYLVEPGTQDASHTVQALRNTLAEEVHILGPCAHSLPCPMNLRPKDWCHFTLRMTPGPLARRISEMAQRRFQDTHFSWLVLENASPRPHSPLLHRVLGVRRNDKNAFRVLSCSASGYSQLTAPKREKEVYRRAGVLQSGDLFELDKDQLELKGDGYRLTNEIPLAPIERLAED